MFIRIYQTLQKRPAIFYVIVAVILGFIAYFGSALKFSEDISSIIPDDDRVEKINSVLNHSKFSDQLVFNFYADSSTSVSPDSLISYADRILGEIAEDSLLVEEIVYLIDDNQYAQLYDFFYANIPFYLDSSHYARIEKQLQTDELNSTLQKDLKVLLSPTGIALKKQILNDPLSIVPGTLERLKNFQFDDNFTIYQSHIFTNDHKHLMAFLVPVNSSGNIAVGTRLIDNIEKILASNANPLIKVEYYGGTAVAVANAHRIKADIILTLSLTLIFLMALFLFVFRKLKVIFFMFVPVILAAGIALTLLIIIEGTISAIAMGIGAVLLGITVDYSIHFYSHYRIAGNMKETLRNIAQPLLMSSVTTAAAFLCLFLVRSEALNQLGLFAAFSVLTASILTLVFLAYLLGRYAPPASFKDVSLLAFDKISGYAYEKNKVLVTLILAVTLLFFLLPGKVGFNGDLSTMNYLPPHLAKAEKNLLSISTQTMSNVYLITSGNTLDEALQISEKYSGLMDSLRHEGIAGRISSASDLMLSKVRQQEKIDQWNAFWDRMGRDKVQQRMVEAGNANFFKADAFNNFYNLIHKDFKPLAQKDFEVIQSMFLKNYIIENEQHISGISILKVEEANKAEVYARVSKYDEIMIFDKQVFTNRFFEILKEDFNKLATFSLLLVFVILFIVFGRLELVLVTQIPLMLSWFWTLGFMRLFNIEFNIFNVIISTYILGLGIDYCIFMVQGCINKYKHGENNLSPYRLSIVLSGITTVLGIGVLLFAKHPALKSIALVSVFGIVSAVVMSFTMVPILFSALVYYKDKKRIAPVTLSGILVSVTAFILFLVGSALLTLLIPVLMILPIGRKKTRYLFHVLLSKTLRIIVYCIFPIKKHIETGALNFSKPAVITCNHQSHLDLALILMLHPKIIVLTNKWVWNNPFYGFVVRFADFYPIFKGVDHALAERLKLKIKDGYSILIFPEGSRTPDGEIHRFHQGAFWLADKLNLDIQPMLLHGANHCMPKQEFNLRAGVITLRALKRVKVSSVPDGESYRLQAKALRSMYRKEFDNISLELQTPGYYYEKLLNGYVYKGPVLEWYARIKVAMENKYAYFNNLVPLDAKIVDIGCGYGFLSHMLYMISGNRKVLGLDYDEQKISVARQICPDASNLTFEAADILNYNLPEADVFILMDILHYLPAEFHEPVIEKCIHKLNKHGFIIIRDADSDLSVQMWRTRLNEFNSTRFFKFNKTQYPSLSFTSGSIIERIAHKHNLVVERRETRSKSPDITFILKHNNQ